MSKYLLTLIYILFTTCGITFMKLGGDSLKLSLSKEFSLRMGWITLLGFLLFVMAYIAFGMLSSSITENQIIAGIISIGFFIITWVLPEFNSSLESYSFINMFYKYTQGQIDIGDTVTFITFTITCLLLTAVVMQRRKSVK